MKLTITSKKDGFRRAGRAWTGSETVDAEAFTETQLRQLHEEPNLVVAEADDEADGADGSSPAKPDAPSQANPNQAGAPRAGKAPAKPDKPGK